MTPQRPSSQVCLLLGSNIAPESNLPKAVELLSLHAEIKDSSLVWETPAMGTEAPNFLNAALLVQTDLGPRQFKETVIHPVEVYLGRVRSKDKFAPRPIDIDIVAWDCQILDPDVWRYVHVAVPVSEVLACDTISETGESLAETAQRLLEETPLQPRLEFSSIRINKTDNGGRLCR